MGISEAIVKLLSRAKPTTLVAIIALLGAGCGSMGTLALRGWWVSETGYSYAVAEAKRYSDLADKVESHEWRLRSLEADRKSLPDLAREVSEIKGGVNALLEQRKRGR